MEIDKKDAEQEYYNKKNSLNFFIHKEKAVIEEIDYLTVRINGIEAAKKEDKESIMFSLKIIGILILVLLSTFKMGLNITSLQYVPMVLMKCVLVVIVVVGLFILAIYFFTVVYRCIRYYYTYKRVPRVYSPDRRYNSKGRMLLYYRGERMKLNVKLQNIQDEIKLLERRCRELEEIIN